MQLHQCVTPKEKHAPSSSYNIENPNHQEEILRVFNSSTTRLRLFTNQFRLGLFIGHRFGLFFRQLQQGVTGGGLQVRYLSAISATISSINLHYSRRYRVAAVRSPNKNRSVLDRNHERMDIIYFMADNLSVKDETMKQLGFFDSSSA